MAKRSGRQRIERYRRRREQKFPWAFNPWDNKFSIPFGTIVDALASVHSLIQDTKP